MASLYAARLSLDLGHSNEALADVNAALTADPLWPLPYQGLDWVQAHRGRFLEAELAGRRLLELSPTYLSGHYYLGLLLLERGDREGALKLMQQEAPEGGRDGGLAIVYYALGRKAESDATLARLIKMGVASAISIAEAHAYRDDRDGERGCGSLDRPPLASVPRLCLGQIGVVRGPDLLRLHVQALLER